MKSRVAICAVVGLALLPLFAAEAGQTVYKCPGPDGKLIYQQNECGDGKGADMKIETGSPSEARVATDDEVAGCLSLIKIAYAYKDPDSLRVEGLAVASIYPSGRKEVMFSLNGKNSYGAYAGAKPAYCRYKAGGDLDEIKAFN
ncbi:MAG: hypothetical protein P9F75_07235 [Candidatus Contendobacter sp.]|nr:hypothetical protein [Candidatus Contendobacter sp.]